MLNPFKLISPIVTLVILGIVFYGGVWVGVQAERGWLTRPIANVVVPRGDRQ